MFSIFLERVRRLHQTAVQRVQARDKVAPKLLENDNGAEGDGGEQQRIQPLKIS